MPLTSKNIIGKGDPHLHDVTEQCQDDQSWKLLELDVQFLQASNSKPALNKLLSSYWEDNAMGNTWVVKLGLPSLEEDTSKAKKGSIGTWSFNRMWETNFHSNLVFYHLFLVSKGFECPK